MTRPSSPVGMMLQFAFGPGSSAGRPSSGMAGHAGGHPGCDASPEMLALMAAAKAWWEQGRPSGWSLEQHLNEPTIGCNSTEKEQALAKAVATWVGQGR